LRRSALRDEPRTACGFAAAHGAQNDGEAPETQIHSEKHLPDNALMQNQNCYSERLTLNKQFNNMLTTNESGC